MFIDRYDAGQQLRKKLSSYTDSDAIVCAIPHGGMPISMCVARDLQLPLELMSVQRIVDPIDLTQSVAVVTETGDYVCNERKVAQVAFDWLLENVEEKWETALSKRAQYTNNMPRCSFTDRHVIVVDDGIVTGMTIKAVIKAVQDDGAKKITVAVPIASHSLVCWLQKHVDEVVVLEETSEPVVALHPYYKHFPEVFDKEVMIVWNHARKTQPTAVRWPETPKHKVSV